MAIAWLLKDQRVTTVLVGASRIEQLDENLWVGRCFADAPEIDGVTYVTGENVEVGTLTPVEIVQRRDYDLVGEAVAVVAAKVNA